MPDLRKRARKVISDVNEVSLMPRLLHLIETRGLPVSDAELKAVRHIGNDEVLDHATAVLCRLTVEHLATPDECCAGADAEAVPDVVLPLDLRSCGPSILKGR